MTTFTPINTFTSNIPHSKSIRSENKSEDAEAKPAEPAKTAEPESK